MDRLVDERNAASNGLLSQREARAACQESFNGASAQNRRTVEILESPTAANARTKLLPREQNPGSAQQRTVRRNRPGALNLQ
jgi:hypothetical protein